ncbi:phytoene/squalene synthase family protein [Halotalea alkalilenta]|uniref:Phytoene synthase n=1 Tax=Halotalea alkalilenta TaxID=376489 RepID=A0A172YG04_9GAMM|nr:phytoene/squalene synthase family protein [Halotalea alkalilenta]ANF58210.1 hypothetical protein A5892_12650 [Halotalea alkalilenta]
MNDQERVDADDALATLGRHGKSFRFASLLMPKRDAEDAARLYTVCRHIDDLADESEPTARPAALARLARIRQELTAGAAVTDPLAVVLHQLAERRGIDLDAADHLISAMISDAERPALIEDSAALIRYCYGAAGSVGVMMAPLVDAPRHAQPFAVDLGLAMQMTNIARDIAEDAAMGRRYLPASWVDGLSPERILTGREEPTIRAIVSSAMARLLDLAECYYASAAEGIQAIPGRNRVAIRVAAVVYRQIGLELAATQHNWWQGRMRIGIAGKLRCTLSDTLGRRGIRPRGVPHDPLLHRVIAGRPGCAAAPE